MRFYRRIFLLAIFNTLLIGCQHDTDLSSTEERSQNVVVKYFNNSEVQAENDAQRCEIRRVLIDMLQKPENELRTSKYRDYQGNVDRRDIIQLIRAHFVPDRPQALKLESFLADVKKTDAQQAIQNKLTEIEKNITQCENKSALMGGKNKFVNGSKELKSIHIQNNWI